MEEEWRECPSYPGVMASSWGRIKLPNRKAKMPHGGYRDYITKPTYGVKRRASKKARHEYYGVHSKFFGNIKVHRAVCEAFHGLPPDDKPYVLHNDENSLNNRPENLSWGSQKENLNAKGFIEYCKTRTGVNSSTKKSSKPIKRLSIEEVAMIKYELNMGSTLRLLAEKYGVSVGNIHHIKSGHSHKNVEAYKP